MAEWIPPLDGRGRVQTLEAVVKQRRKEGMCTLCGVVRTHERRVFRMVRLNNTEVRDGTCLRCAAVAAAALPVNREHPFRPPKTGWERHTEDRTVDESTSAKSASSHRPEWADQVFDPLQARTQAHRPSDATTGSDPARRSNGGIDGSSHTRTSTTTDEPIVLRQGRRQNSIIVQVHRGPRYEVPGHSFYPPSSVDYPNNTIRLYPKWDAKYPEDPPMKTGKFPFPRIHEGARAAILTVQEHNAPERRNLEEVYLVRNEHNATRAYRRHKHLPTKQLPGTFGSIVFCVVLPRVQNETRTVVFSEPDPSQYTLVAIKKYRRAVVDPPLYRREDAPNPYLEVSILQHMGNNGIIEALLDPYYIYIVCPYSAGFRTMEATFKPGTLLGTQRLGGMDPANVRAIMSELVQDVSALQKRGVSHRNLSLESIVVRNRNSCWMDDFCWALRIPYAEGDEETHPRHWIRNQGESSSNSDDQLRPLSEDQTLLPPNLAYMAPEIYESQDFDGHAVDVWSLGSIMATLLIGRKLFEMPSAMNQVYETLIICGAITDDEIVEQMRVVLELQNETGDLLNHPLYVALNAVIALPPAARELLRKMMHPIVSSRFTISQVASHDWLRT